MYLTNLSVIEGDDYYKHQIIKSFFPGDQKVLFQENDDGVTVVSEKPSGSNSTAIDLSSYSVGDKLSFTLRLNPTKRDMKTKKRVALDALLVKEWIRKQLKAAGVEANFQYLREGIRRSNKDGKTVSFSSVLCFGVLTIADINIFCEVLGKGIGHGKGFGFGLINIFS